MKIEEAIVYVMVQRNFCLRDESRGMTTDQIADAINRQRLHIRQDGKPVPSAQVFINEQPIGIMQGKEVSIELPSAQFDLSIKILFRLFKWQFSIGGKRKICLSEGEHQHLMITDKEGLARHSEGGSQRWWNILFDIDLVFWLIRFFVEFPYPWNIVYEVVSNGFFALWLARIWFIRDRYFQIIEQQNSK